MATANPFFATSSDAQPVLQVGAMTNPFLVPNSIQKQDDKVVQLSKAPKLTGTEGKNRKTTTSSFDVEEEGFVPATNDSSFVDAYPVRNETPKVASSTFSRTQISATKDYVNEDDETENQDVTNPLFAVAGISDQAKIKVLLENYRKRGRIEVDGENDDREMGEVTSSDATWRFSGSMQSDDEEEMEGFRIGGSEAVSAEEAAHRQELSLDTPPYMFFTPANRKNKRQRKMMGTMPSEFKADRGMQKYWLNRYKLFSRYDEGIKLDYESWFSVTPENIAIHVAERCSTDGIIIDAFCGCGGNTIQFAKKAAKVIAIDIDPVKIENARHNARIYGVEDNITFVVADFMALAPALKGDIVFLSPPWGGPEYAKVATFDLRTMIPMDGIKLFELAEDISPNIAYYVPRNVNRDQLAQLSGPGNAVEIEANYSDGHIKALTAYYGELIA